jgi:hypothetical protein
VPQLRISFQRQRMMSWERNLIRPYGGTRHRRQPGSSTRATASLGTTARQCPITFSGDPLGGDGIPCPSGASIHRNVHRRQLRRVQAPTPADPFYQLTCSRLRSNIDTAVYASQQGRPRLLEACAKYLKRSNLTKKINSINIYTHHYKDTH